MSLASQNYSHHFCPELDVSYRPTLPSPRSCLAWDYARRWLHWSNHSELEPLPGPWKGSLNWKDRRCLLGLQGKHRQACSRNHPLLLRFPWSCGSGSWSNLVGKSCFQGNLLNGKDEEGLLWAIKACKFKRDYHLVLLVILQKENSNRIFSNHIICALRPSHRWGQWSPERGSDWPKSPRVRRRRRDSTLVKESLGARIAKIGEHSASPITSWEELGQLN